MKNIAGKVQELIAPIVEGFGLELLEVEYKKKYDAMNLTVYIDKEGGITLDDCEKVHKAIDAPLDELDPTEGQHYILNVSSPGLDRPLKTERDYVRNNGKEIEVSLYTPQDEKKKHPGILCGWTADTVTISVNGADKTFNKKDISIIKPII